MQRIKVGVTTCGRNPTCTGITPTIPVTKQLEEEIIINVERNSESGESRQ
jgi:hypothetical protein